MKVKKIRKICSDCSGEGYVSYCCGAEMYGNQCSCCNKFAKKTHCCGDGEEWFEVGQEVWVFVCIFSPSHLKALFPKIKKHGDTVTRKARILKIVGDYKVSIKLNYIKQPITVTLDEISEEF